ncbi:serine/threonine-protein kinase [Amycolatopsis nigrescens]|uniref:serine/threonine-protein kinase n=1 Tax=Amycolatopsis nigrescens TaxID=381445 RepID=UPI000373CAC8|nr:serine/threonine-protein kinase [Amycolatopsis nigrescens]
MGQETEPRFDLDAVAGLGDGQPRRERPSTVGDRYLLKERIGTGGSATVYRATDTATGAEVAVKLFHSGAAQSGERRYAQEIRILSELQHPGLVALHDAGTENERAFLVTQLVIGETLAARIQCGALSAAETAELATPLAEALAYVHSTGVTHRDLKPANVLLGADGPKLSDFGIARAFDTTRMTESGVVLGTAAYMAPEQVNGGEIGPPADIYAFGLVLLECLTGRREYPGTLLESALARLHRKPVLPTGLPAPFADLLRRMTSIDPAKRPSSTEVAASLHALREAGAPTRALTTPPTPVPRIGKRRSRLLLALGAPLALLALGAVALFGSGGEPPAPGPAPAAPVPTSPAGTPAAPQSPAPPATGLVVHQLPPTSATSGVELPPAAPSTSAEPPGKSEKQEKKKQAKESRKAERQDKRDG